jgi:hypothetical protein
LSVIGNTLCITIPENWLSEAKYPVTVDPVIGLSSLGALGPEDEGGDENSYWGFNDGDGMNLSGNMGVNRFTAPHAISGNCTAHLYVDYYPGGYYWSTSKEKVWPVLYTHDPAKDRPDLIKSSGGGYISNDVGRPAGPPRGWRSTGVTVDGTIGQGQTFWFGFLFWAMEPRYDYGGRLYRCFALPYQDTYAGLRQKFYKYPMNVETEYYEDEKGNEIEYEVWAEPAYNLKISMYLEYTAPSTNYTRTITQGVNLTDSRKRAAGYRRAAVMNARGTTLLGHSSNYRRKQTGVLTVSGVLNRFRGCFRTIAEQVKPTEVLSYCRDFFRAISVTVRPLTHEGRTHAARRDIAGHAGAGDRTARHRGLIRTLVTAVTAADYAGKVSALLCAIQEQASAWGEAGYMGDYLRGLYTEAGSAAETKYEGEYYREVADTAGSTGVSLRHLFVFIRLATLSLVRDYLLTRFLRSREELAVKSVVTKELELDSRL